MEEKKMPEEVKQEVKDTPKKMTYEQLENVAHQLSAQANQLYTKLQEANMTNMFKRLDYLFKVVENAHAFDEEFVNRCVSEIEDLITLPDNVEESDTESEDKPEE